MYANKRQKSTDRQTNTQTQNKAETYKGDKETLMKIPSTHKQIHVQTKRKTNMTDKYDRQTN